MSETIETNLKWYKSLRIRLVLMMSLALLPIGLIALIQTNSVSTKARQNEELALLALTEQAALQERLVIQSAFGAARGMGAMLSDSFNDTEQCNRALSKLVASVKGYSFAEVVDLSGRSLCSSDDLSKRKFPVPDFASVAEAGKPAVVTKRSLQAEGASAVFIMQPFYSRDTLSGFISITVPHKALTIETETIASGQFFDIVTLNHKGELLSSQNDWQVAKKALPTGFNIDWLSSFGPRVFLARSSDGVPRTYTAVPVEGGQMFVVGIWSSDRERSERFLRILSTSIFPILMWIFSLTVALITIHRLLTRQINSIGQQMLEFARDRTSVTDTIARDMPNELRTIQDSYLSMADSILREEAKMEDAMRHQSVLTKEVHHRVKNNLQLISSILNMQIRAAKHDETKLMLRRIQDRVLSLATIHRDLYQSGTGGQVNMGELIREVIEKTVQIGSEKSMDIDVKLDVEDVMLFPDQAVPMSLLVAEAATNAMKYVGAPEGQKPWISVELKNLDEGTKCCLELKNSTGAERDVESTGLGAKLISAFAIQLDADIDITEEENTYTMLVNFDIATFKPESADF
ncbi:sensor histidine kinase [Neptunicoccus cionae]|uniref:sensor histidine kinase n=1 Tax=Neptunicoccus cionae TaxID=2035344 RepID=UPI0011AEA01E|nr:sensor histidine kinase [Amylibacter cionae]